MIKIFSIKEIILASKDILNSHNQKKLINKNVIANRDISIPNSKNKIINNEKMSDEKPLILSKKINKSEDNPQRVEKIILQAEKNQFKNFNIKSKKNNIINYQKVIDELFGLFNKKIKKNTLKLIVDLRNNIVSLDERILSLKEEEQEITIKNKLLKDDIKNLMNNGNKLKIIVKKKDIDLNQLNIKINDDQNKLNQLENDKSDLNLKLKGYQNQNIKLENENKNLEQNSKELKSQINKLQDQVEYFEKISGELKIKLEKNINQNKLYKHNNNELNLKLDELNELKQYKFKYLEYKQKNFDLENTLAKIKVDEDKNLQISNVINELEDKIKFYQEENIRIGTELLETKKKSEIFKDEIEKYENQRSSLIEKINSVNDVVQDSNIVTNVFENNKDKIHIRDPKKINNNQKLDLNTEIEKIFSRK